MSKKKKDDRYSKAIESGIWWDDELEEHDYEAFFDDFTAELFAAPLEDKHTVMRRFGIWYGPQR